jgi:MFS family permease
VRNQLKELLRHPLIFPLYLPSLIFAFSEGLIVPTLPLYMLASGVSYGLIGLVLAGEGLGMLFGNVPAGIMLRRFGEKQAMALGVGLAAFSTAALFWLDFMPLVVMCRLLAGFGIALFNLSRHAYLAEEVILTNRGRAIALYGGINRLGKFMGPAAGGAIAAAYGLRMPFLVYSAISLMVMVLIIFTTSSAQPGHLKTPIKSHQGHLLATLAAHYRVLLTAGVGQLFAQLIRAGRPVIIPLYGAAIGLDVQAIGLIISITSAIDMSLFYPAGWAMDRWGRKFAIVPCFLIQAIGMALIPLTDSFGGLLFAAGLIGFGNGLGSGTMMTLGADLAPKEQRGEFLGVWRLVGDAGASSAPLIVGWVAALLVLQTSIWVIAGAGLASVAIFALFVPETLKKQPAVSGLAPISAEVKT